MIPFTKTLRAIIIMVRLSGQKKTFSDQKRLPFGLKSFKTGEIKAGGGGVNINNT